MLSQTDKNILDEIAHRMVFHKEFTQNELNRLMEHRLSHLQKSSLKKAVGYYNRVVLKLTPEKIHIL